MKSGTPAVEGSPAAVTVVLSTYNRPDALRTAIRSVLRQTFEGWRLLVVGDNCSPATGEAVRSFPDGRISYIDLPFRFGEQSGPNSVGICLSDTEFTALLNHDDAWLPDHLERALAALGETGADIFIGRAAVAAESVEEGAGGRRPVFDTVTPFPGPPPRRFFHRQYALCEPASAWVFRTDPARKTGPWRSHREIYRAPLQDWLLRFWRGGGRFAYGDEVTLLNLTTQYQYRSGEGCYAVPSAEHGYVDELLDRFSPAETRKVLFDGLSDPPAVRKAGRCYRAESRLGKLLFRFVANDATALLYRFTGVDLYSALIPLAGARPGEKLSHISRVRTGTDSPVHDDFNAAVGSAVSRVIDCREEDQRD